MTTMTVLDSAGSTVTVEKPLTPGRAAATASRPVVFSNEDNATIGALTETAPASDTASSGLNGRLQRIAQRLTSLIALIPAALGQTTKSASLAVTIASDDDVQGKLGSLTETAPGTDTASSGLNGRLQRIAQRLTSLIAQVPASLGIKTAANSLSITHASDDTVVVATGAPADAAWASGSGSLVALLKTLATAALDTTTPSPVSMRQPCDVVPLTPTLDTSAYASGDTLFVTTALAGAVRATDERAILQSLTLMDKAKNNPAMRLLFFKSNVAFGTINVAPSLSDADAVNYLGHIDIAAADWVTLANNSICCKSAIGLLLEAATGTTTVYVAAMLTAGTPTYAASDLVLGFGLVQS